MKNINRIITTGMILAAALLAGCGRAEPTHEVVHSTPSVLPTTTTAPTTTPTDTVAVTATPTDLPTPTIPPPAEQCIELSESTEPLGSGVLALQYFTDHYRDLIMKLVIIDSGQTFTFKHSSAVPAVSPDYSKIAYIDDFNAQLMVVDAKGWRLASIPVSITWREVIGWTDDHTVLIEKTVWRQRWSNELSSIIVFDIATGTYEEIPPDLPEIVPMINLYGHGPEWLGNIAFLPNPQLTYLVYAAWPDTQETSIVLWDMAVKSEVNRYETFGGNDWESLPEWSTDGNYFITSLKTEQSSVEGAKDLFLIKTNGKTEQLTNLSRYYVSKQRGYSLSPDDSILAFWLSTNFQDSNLSNEFWYLSNIDLLSKEMMVYCVNGGRNGYPKAPVWSPDGKQLLVTAHNSYYESKTVSYIVDIKTRSIYELPGEVIGAGWLRSEQ